MTSRWLYGLWIDAHTVSTPLSASYCASAPRHSIGIAASR